MTAAHEERKKAANVAEQAKRKAVFVTSFSAIAMLLITASLALPEASLSARIYVLSAVAIGFLLGFLIAKSWADVSIARVRFFALDEITRALDETAFAAARHNANSNALIAEFVKDKREIFDLIRSLRDEFAARDSDGK
jgi:hypothetical protein